MLCCLLSEGDQVAGESRRARAPIISVVPPAVL